MRTSVKVMFSTVVQKQKTLFIWSVNLTLVGHEVRGNLSSSVYTLTAPSFSSSEGPSFGTVLVTVGRASAALLVAKALDQVKSDYTYAPPSIVLMLVTIDTNCLLMSRAST
jgi:hypothetical protein